MTTIDETVLDPTNPEDRQKVREALVHYVNQLSSSEIVDLLIAIQGD